MSRVRAARHRVAVVTGTRAEYGLLRSALAAIRAHPRLGLQVIVCGMHLLARFGRTVREVERDGWPIIARVRMQRGDDSPTDQAAGLARGVRGIAEALHAARSTIVLVLGDRIEALAGALAAVTTGIRLAHVHGGDVAPGDFDDAVRDAITQLADLHFPASRVAARRLVGMGVPRDRVHVVGAPGLDRLFELARARTARRAARDPAARRRTALVVYHPTGRAAAIERSAMETLLEVVAAEDLRRVIIYPNSDRGHSGVVAAIRSHVRRSDRGEVVVHRSLPRDAYISTLLDADVVVGNSSSGIIEAPAVGTPAVDVGDRQRGRLHGGPGVFHAAESRSAIAAALRRALCYTTGRRPRRRPARGVYGDGHAGERIARILADA